MPCVTCEKPSSGLYCGECLDRVRAMLKTETDLYYHLGPVTGNKIAGVLPGKYRREFWTKKRMRQVRYASLVLIGILGVLLSIEVRNRRVAAEAEYWRGVGQNHAERRDWDSAISAFSRSIEYFPDAKTHLYRGVMHMNRGDRLSAIADCEAALKLEPWNEAARMNLRDVSGRFPHAPSASAR